MSISGTSQTASKVLVREASLARDRADVLHAISSLEFGSDEKRFEWLYERNPAGPARIWLAESGSRVIGVAAAFPRMMQFGSSTSRAWLLGDFCIAAEYRSMGPALTLQRACLNDLGKTGDLGWYDFPSVSMRSIYARLGFKPSCEHTRFTKILRTDAHLSGAAKSILRGPANLALKVREKLRSGAGDETKIDSTISAGLDVLADTFSSYAISVNRSERYLKWRYVENPVRRYEFANFESQGRITGWCAFSDDNTHLWIEDMFFVPGEHSKALQSMLSSITRIAIHRGRHRINLPLTAGAEITSAVRALGFIARESVPIYSQFGGDSTPNLYLTMGDRDS